MAKALKTRIFSSKAKAGLARTGMVAPVLALALLTGCVQNSDGTYSTTRAGVGAGLGAVGGALLGGTVTKSTTGAVVGGVAGAAIGGAIGNQLDRQAQELQTSMAGTGVEVQRQPDRIQLVFPGDVTFATNSADIQPQFYGALSSLANSLQQYPNSQVYVIGHTDTVGSYDYNLQLSQLRANSVGRYLANSGVPYHRIYTAGRSYSEPKASNNTPTGRAMNRRVEIEIIPQG